MARIGILGAGAMGSYFGALLAIAGHAIALVDPDADRMEAIGRDGLTLVQPTARRVVTVRAGSAPSLLDRAEFVIVQTKANDLETAIQSTGSHLGPTTAVAVLSNGLGCGEVASRWVKPEQLVYGATAAGAVLDGPAVVRETVIGNTYLGRWQSRADATLLRLSSTLDAAGITTVACDDVDPWIWTKLLVNVVFNAATSVAKVRNGALVETQAGRRLVEMLVGETSAVAAGRGIALTCEDPLAYVMGVGAKIAENESSMLQDLLRRRATEVDQINGGVVAEARRLGLPAPVNEALTHLVHLCELGIGVP